MADLESISRRLDSVETLLKSIARPAPGGGYTDPPPYEWSARSAARAYYPWPWGPQVDPAPSEWWTRPLPRPAPAWPWGPQVDPAPSEWLGRGALGPEMMTARAGYGYRWPWGPEVDPSPTELSRMTAVQLQGVKDMIAIERRRLDALEELLDKNMLDLKG